MQDELAVLAAGASWLGLLALWSAGAATAASVVLPWITTTKFGFFSLLLAHCVHRRYRAFYDDDTRRVVEAANRRTIELFNYTF